MSSRTTRGSCGLFWTTPIRGRSPSCSTWATRFHRTSPPAKIVRKYASRIPLFHLRDSIAGKEVLFGAGEFDFAELGRTLAETGWGGWLIVEVNRDPQIPSRKMAESARDFVRKQMKLY